MSLELSQKRFFAKLLGLAALGGLFPRIVAIVAADRKAAPVARPGPAWTLRSEPRAVARRSDRS